MKNKIFTLSLLTVFLISLRVESQDIEYKKPEKGFISWNPATNADEALLSGNGAMGVMVYGRPLDDVVILNHAQSFLPLGIPAKPVDQASRLDEIRKLLAEGQYAEAVKIPVEQSQKEDVDKQKWSDPFVPVADLRINMQPGNVKNYQRGVDFKTGETFVQWEQDGQIFQRTVFVSRPDSVIVISIKSTGKINCSFQFERHPWEWNQNSYIHENIKSADITVNDSWMLYRTEFAHQWEGNIQGFEALGKVTAFDGQVTDNGREISVVNASEVLVLIKIEPNFNWDKSLIELLKDHILKLPQNYASLIDNHKKIHGELFNRVCLDLGPSPDSLLDCEPMRLEAHNKITPNILVKEFDAARYNIISCAGINPPNLQGIWGSSWTPPWSADFTHDGNVEVSVSSMLSTSTPELLWSYINYHERMLPMYRENAQRLFGCRGINIPGHSSSFGWSVQVDPTWCLTFWTGGAGWASFYFYDYYLYTNDKNFLANHAYPFMKEAALFYEDFLFTGADGKYIFSPSYSPENNPANGISQACINATMDMAIAKELLRNCIASATVLNVDKDKIALWKAMLAKLPDYQVNADGALAEWLWPNMIDNYRHRHISQLYGLFDLMAPDFKTNATLRDAAVKLLKKKIDFRRSEDGGEMAFGLAQMGMVACNLEDGDDAGWIIDKLAANYWSNSLSSQHNVGGLFNMDISGGFPALIVKSLIYSEPGYISVLPAISEGWKAGSLKGTSLRGGLKATDLTWDDKQVSLSVNAPTQQTVSLHIPFNFKTLTVNGKIVKTKAGTDSKIILEAGKENSIVITKN